MGEGDVKEFLGSQLSPRHFTQKDASAALRYKVCSFLHLLAPHEDMILDLLSEAALQSQRVRPLSKSVNILSLSKNKHASVGRHAYFLTV